MKQHINLTQGKSWENYSTCGVDENDNLFAIEYPIIWHDKKEELDLDDFRTVDECIAAGECHVSFDWVIRCYSATKKQREAGEFLGYPLIKNTDMLDLTKIDVVLTNPRDYK